MTMTERRIMWEVAITGERAPEHLLGERMLRYIAGFTRQRVGASLERLVRDRLVERFTDGERALLRFGPKVSDARRRAFEDAAIATATERRVELVRSGRSAVVELRVLIEEQAAALTGAPVMRPAFGGIGEMERMVARMRDAVGNLNHLDSWVGLDDVAAHLRPRMRDLYRPVKL